MPKSKPSEVEIVAMAMAEIGSYKFEPETIASWWNTQDTKSRAYYRREARKFVRALRGGR